MIKTLVGQEALGLFIFLKKMKPDVLKMLWMERYADYFDSLEPEVVLPRRSFYEIFETASKLIFFWLQALLGRPLRISFALEKIRGAPVVVPRLPNGNA